MKKEFSPPHLKVKASIDRHVDEILGSSQFKKFLKKERSPLLSRVFYLMARNIVDESPVDAFIDGFLKSEFYTDKTKGAPSKVKKEIENFFKKKKKGIREYFIREFKDVSRVKELPQDAPGWMKEKVNEDPDFLEKEEVFQFDENIEDENILKKMKELVVYFVKFLKENPKESLRLVTLEQALKDSKGFKTEKEYFDEELGQIEVIPQLKEENGLRWVEIVDSSALEREGNLMGHCVGDDKYCEGLEAGEIRLFSLRDSSNRPRVTIEYNILNNSIDQFQGKENSPPHPRYSGPIARFLNYMFRGKVRVGDDDLENLGIFEHRGKFYLHKENLLHKDEVIDRQSLNDVDRVMELLVQYSDFDLSQIPEEVEDKIFSDPELLKGLVRQNWLWFEKLPAELKEQINIGEIAVETLVKDPYLDLNQVPEETFNSVFRNIETLKKLVFRSWGWFRKIPLELKEQLLNDKEFIRENLIAAPGRLFSLPKDSILLSLKDPRVFKAVKKDIILSYLPFEELPKEAQDMMLEDPELVTHLRQVRKNFRNGRDFSDKAIEVVFDGDFRKATRSIIWDDEDF